MFNENKYFVDKLRNLTPHFREGKKKKDGYLVLMVSYTCITPPIRL